MTITNTASRWAYPGNGVTTAFAYTNLIFAASDLKVYLDGVLQTTGYTVSNVGVVTGGNVTFSIPPANHASVVIVRDVPATQDIDYLANDPFPAATHEKGLDKLTILAQQLAARLPRTLQLADGRPGHVHRRDTGRRRARLEVSRLRCGGQSDRSIRRTERARVGLC
jgi:hypothetical protein